MRARAYSLISRILLVLEPFVELCVCVCACVFFSVSFKIHLYTVCSAWPQYHEDILLASRKLVKEERSSYLIKHIYEDDSLLR